MTAGVFVKGLGLRLALEQQVSDCGSLEGVHRDPVFMEPTK
jgi:hypothetical protein